MGARLPAEIWLQIGGHLPSADLSRLVLVSNAFHSLLLPLLHRDVIISGPYRGATDRDERLQTIRNNLERIGAKPNLVPAIRSCRLQELEGALLEEVIGFLGTLPNLASLFLNNLTFEADQLIRLSKGWRSPVKFVTSFVKVKSTDLLPSIIKEAPPNLSSLKVANSAFFQKSWRLFVQWSFSDNLETLSFESNTEPMFNALFEEHISTLPKVSFPRLKSLYLSILPGRKNQGRFFDCMPMLEILHLARKYSTCRGPLAISETAIPKLRSYEGLAINILSLVPRRPIYHLSISVFDMLPTLWGSHAPPLLNFGSTSAIRYLYLSQTGDPLPSLQLIALVCPSLYELQLASLTTSHLSAFEFVQSHIQHLYKLTELRRLVYNFFVHVPTHNSIGWQRQICEALEGAAPNLTNVSLMSVITWHKSEVSGEWKAGGMGLQALETRFLIGLAKWPALPPPKKDS